MANGPIPDRRAATTPHAPAKMPERNKAAELLLVAAGRWVVAVVVVVVEAHIEGLLLITKWLEDQVRSLTKQRLAMAARLEDQEGRARLNICIVVVPEGMEGPSVDLFIMDLVLSKLQPKRLERNCLVLRQHIIPHWDGKEHT
ncbi:hypothetical protein NDU88_004032 [Pleurodeles waltl]|uniref:Uncharacterized protein n=1 Tax=Pleurodeles waltl TaxID=8319 RepID=A0AAV7V1U0_PLEWA|nr:hypothetical protein NDU88_004032 [Pleurodeles waltl]